MKLKLLFLSSNPHQDLSLDEEYRAVQEALENHQESIELINLSAVRIDDLIKAINREKPNIIHFTGHGNENGELLFTDDSGHYDELVSANSLKKLFSTEKEHIKLVFLNACHSMSLAETIHEEIDCVIGMNSQIKKATATALAKTFYSSFVSGRTIKDSFNQAIVKLESSYPEEAETPFLFHDNENLIQNIKIKEFQNKRVDIDIYRMTTPEKLPNYFQVKKIVEDYPKNLNTDCMDNIFLKSKIIKEHINKIDNKLKEHKILLIYGLAKIGKSFLASNYLNNYRNNYDYYSYICIKDNIKKDFIEQFKILFNIDKNLIKIDIDKAFYMIKYKLSSLQGSKLLIIDLNRVSKVKFDDFKLILNLVLSDFKILILSRNYISDINAYYYLNVPSSIEDVLDIFLNEYHDNEIEFNGNLENLKKLLNLIDFHPYFVKIISYLIIKQNYTLDELLYNFNNGNFYDVDFIDKDGRNTTLGSIVDNIINLDNLSYEYKNILFEICRLNKKNNDFSTYKDFSYFIKNIDNVKTGQLSYLVDNGWLIKRNGNEYKIPKFIEEYIYNIRMSK